jgi:hypothetical protein
MITRFSLCPEATAILQFFCIRFQVSYSGMHCTGDVVVGMNIHTEHMGIKIKEKANQFKIMQLGANN